MIQANVEPKTLLSVVLPTYNEVAVLGALTEQLEGVFEELGLEYELIFVNDGSTDGSDEALDGLARADSRVKVLHLSRNFGHQSALLAGLRHASGDAVIVMDSDLQDDPAAIGEFIQRWRAGYDVVYAIRTKRKEHAVKRLLFHGFYRVLGWVSRMPIPPDAGNFGLLDRRVVKQVAGLVDRDRYFPGQRCWVGFRQIGIPIERAARYDRTPRVSLLGLFRLAKSAVFSFSSLPLSLFYAIAAVSMLVFVGLSGYALYHKLFTNLAIAGWTSMTITASFFGALNALGIAVLGEYVVRIYDQVRNRPSYIVAEKTNFAAPQHEASEEEAWTDYSFRQ